MYGRIPLFVLLLTLGAACNSAPPVGPGSAADSGKVDPESDGGLRARRLPPPPVSPTLCSDIHADDVLPTFEIDIDPAHWRRIEEDFQSGVEKYYPVKAFRYGDELITDAMIRLRGNHSRCWGKMQFAIAFNRVDKDGRFHGLRRINLDHGGCQLVEERLALSFMRDLGLPAPCANHARLVLNGAYYGLFTNLEHVNQDFLSRVFELHGDGNLYKNGWELRTNEDQKDLSRLAAYQQARDVAAVGAVVDIDEAITAWAAEAVLPALDNYWLKGHNFYTYDHPERGFVFIPSDLDQALPLTEELVGLETLLPETLPHPADVVLADPAYRARYADALRTAVSAFDADFFEARLDAWWAQIQASAAADPHHVYTRERLDYVKTQIRARERWLHESVGGRVHELRAE